MLQHTVMMNTTSVSAYFECSSFLRFPLPLPFTSVHCSPLRVHVPDFAVAMA
ncbi:hypothetical protein BJ165DRAFT_1479211 [Panaeolus papilionaceus]|nr:hypothetical protein BJ165DRAFT_1479211 [Panaeolus papilionaceus]